MAHSRLLTRVRELRASGEKKSTKNSYFWDFGSLATSHPKLRFLGSLEATLAVLDDAAWEDLKERAAPLVTKRDLVRGWQALFDTLAEAKGYVYLRTLGCVGIRFLPRSTVRTPDLEGAIGGARVLCEVKAFNVSKDQANRRLRVGAAEIFGAKVATQLEHAFLELKLQPTLASASAQLAEADPQHLARRIVFAVIYFDDWVCDYQENYLQQIDEYLVGNPLVGAEFVLALGFNAIKRTRLRRFRSFRYVWVGPRPKRSPKAR